jgi:hypothetical protein
MADYTVIDYNTLLPGEPLTSAKAIASFENPEAIAEGADGAPKIAALALKERTTFASAGPTAYVTVTDLDAFRTVTINGYATQSAGATINIGLSVSTNNGASWETDQIIAVLDVDSANQVFTVNLDLVRGLAIGQASGAASDGRACIFTVQDYNAFRIRAQSVSTINCLIRTEECKAV